MMVIHEMTGGVHHVGSLKLAAAVKAAGNNVWQVSDIGAVTLDWTVSQLNTVTRSTTKDVTKETEVTKAVTKEVSAVDYVTKTEDRTCTRQVSFTATNVPTRVYGKQTTRCEEYVTGYVTRTITKAADTRDCSVCATNCDGGPMTVTLSNMVGCGGGGVPDCDQYEGVHVLANVGVCSWFKANVVAGWGLYVACLSGAPFPDNIWRMKFYVGTACESTWPLKLSCSGDHPTGSGFYAAAGDQCDGNYSIA